MSGHYSGHGVFIDAADPYTEINRTVYGQVHGAQPVATGEGKRAFRPERITVKYQWHSNHPVTARVELTGPWVDEVRPGTGFLLFPSSSPELPEWAVDFVAANLPDQDVPWTLSGGEE
jgi:hypothetical protein